MKKLLISMLAAASMIFMAGCSWSVGGGSKTAAASPTLGQSLIDLQRAKDAGVITEAEFQMQKARLLEK